LFLFGVLFLLLQGELPCLVCKIFAALLHLIFRIPCFISIIDIFGRIFYPAPNSIFPLIKHFLFQNKGSAEASPYKGGKHPFLSGQNEQGSAWLS